MSSSVHIDNKNKDILVLGEGPKKGLDDNTLTAGAKYPINFTQPRKILVLLILQILSKTKNLLPFRDTNNKLKQVLYW